MNHQLPRSSVRSLRKPIWCIEAENPHGLLYQITDSCSGWLPASSPQFKIFWTIIVPLPVTVMHLLFWQQRPPQYRSHDFCMLRHISLLVGVGVVWFPDVDVTIAGPEPALPEIQRRKRLALPELLIVGCAVAAAVVPVRATGEVAAGSSTAQGFSGRFSYH
jgi:hypothetical protein